VPVNPQLRGAFLDHIVDDADARLALVRPEFAAQLPAGASQIVEVDRADRTALDNGRREIERWPEPAEASCVIYTSGTTGPAKGVLLSWAQLASTIGRIPRSFFSATDAAFAFNPMFHVTGRSPLLSMTDVGGRVVLRERFSASNFFDDVRKHAATTATVQPALVLATPERADDRDNPLRIVFGSHNPVLARRFADRFDVHVIDAYGSTEVGFPIIRRWQCDETERSCGRLRRGYAARVVDADGGEVPDGTPGELWIRPPARPLVMLSYLNHPEATAAAFSGDWYRTGDALIRRADGRFEFVDRLRDTIRRMGENISALEIENVVDTHPQVEACAVLAVPDSVAGHEVLLVVQTAGEAVVDLSELFEWLTERLPRYMLPAYLAIADELPRTPTGKVQKTGLLAAQNLTTAWQSPYRRGTTTRS
jgi:carnitine-CoA ligase